MDSLNKTLDLSPRFAGNAFILSPLFSTKNHTGGFFQGFTPKNFTPKGFPMSGFLQTPTNLTDYIREDSLMRPIIPLQKESDYNSTVDQLKEEIKNNSNTTESGNSNEQKGLNLDIDLINDSFIAVPMNKSPNLTFPSSQPNSKGSFKKISEWSTSPNASSFQLRKKIDNG